VCPMAIGILSAVAASSRCLESHAAISSSYLSKLPLVGPQASYKRAVIFGPFGGQRPLFFGPSYFV